MADFRRRRKTLRDRTSMPMMECKAALTEADGDMDKAVEILRKSNKDVQVKNGDRETAEGRIGVYIDPAKKVGAIVEVRCESAPVAKSELFVQLANDLAKQVAAEGAGHRSRRCWPSRSSDDPARPSTSASARWSA